MNINGFTVTSLDTVSVFDLTTGAFKFMVDELQNVGIAQSEEKTPITGKQGRKLSSLKKNKAVAITGANGLIVGGLAEMQYGSTFENKTTKVLWHDYKKVTGNASTTTYTAVGASGAEIIAIIVKNSSGVAETTLTQAASVSAGHFTYDPLSKAIAFYAGVEASEGVEAIPADIADGTDIVITYERQIQADVLTNKSDKYSCKGEIFIDGTAEDKCGHVGHIQFHVPKGDFDGNVTLDMGDNQTVHNFTVEALAGACGTSGEFFTWTIFGSDAADVPDT